jgi:polysaccharide deacetylase 2 family uncharacterized protein YibQ
MAKKRNVRSRRKSPTAVLVLVLLLLISILLTLLYFTFRKEENILELSKKTMETVDALLEQHEGTASLLLAVQQEKLADNAPYLYNYRKYDFPDSITAFRKELARRLNQNETAQKVRILFFSERKEDLEKITTIKMGYKGIVFYQLELVSFLEQEKSQPLPNEPEPSPKLPLPQSEKTESPVPLAKQYPPAKARIAIILDDIGSEPERLFNRFILFPDKLAFAVMPNLPETKSRVAKLKTRKRFRIMLHQPMEPESWESREMRLEPNTILTNMDETQITAILKENLKQVPAKGLNNHQGSLATSNPRVMAVLMQFLRSHRLFFIDSYTSSFSVGHKIADKMKVPYAKRDVFLDNENTEPYVQGQFDKLLNLALKEGTAIGIGHGTKAATIAVLMKNYERTRESGIEFVWPDEILK